MKNFRANGKLLLSGEYTVLRGALALAIPSRLGQLLQVEPILGSELLWSSYSVDGEVWFTVRFDHNLSIFETNDQAKALNLRQILITAKKLNPSWQFSGNKARTDLEFHRFWGLGSSSTLVALVAQWAEVDAFQLFFESQKGSGYDVACALQNKPLVYQLISARPRVESVEFSPDFKTDLGFVYLGQKQVSEREVIAFAEMPVSQEQLNAISSITKQMVVADDLLTFESLLLEHEKLTGNILDRTPVKDLLFGDYPGMVKSLGAWGGDFVLVTRFSTNTDYFISKGYSTCLTWQEMIGT